MPDNFDALLEFLEKQNMSFEQLIRGVNFWTGMSAADRAYAIDLYATGRFPYRHHKMRNSSFY